MAEIIYKVKRRFNITSIYYLIFFIAVGVTIFFLTSKLFLHDFYVITYENNTLTYTSNVRSRDARNLIDTLKNAYYLNENTKDVIYMTKTQDNGFLVMITESTFRFNDSDDTLYKIAKIISGGLGKNVEFGKCDDEFLKVKTAKYLLNN